MRTLKFSARSAFGRRLTSKNCSYGKGHDKLAFQMRPAICNVHRSENWAAVWDLCRRRDSAPLTHYGMFDLLIEGSQTMPFALSHLCRR